MPHSYLVCASQRSGSTLLVKSLRATGLAGDPKEFFQYHPETSLSPQPADWFAGVTDESVLRLLAPGTVGTPSTETSEQWRARIRREGTGPNGVWGGKLMWNQTPLLLDRAAGLADRSGSDLLSAIHDTVGEVRFVKVTRRDVVDQAVSFWRAVQTRVWEGPTAPELDARAQYHPDGIAHLVQILRDQETGWRSFFASTGITPIEVDFTELATDTERVLSHVLDRLDIPAEAPEPALKKQGDLRSSEWAERYRRDARKAGLPT
ncbi:MAG: Stf0 family sulfotransferase [Gordonia sp. (in: high G+C Gram-positive bacteria)]|uniref:trehalose 2-sulfotransferase n=1 Tax=Gordonia sp. (in: high G+C Gram-positive bacteria) TaxID=84139 RepID=UPI0039E69DF1